MKKILGLDLGTKTLGIAISDGLGLAAHGYENFTFEEFNYKKARERVIEIASDEGDYVLDCYIGSGTTMAVAHKLNRHYIGIEKGKQMSELVVRRMNMVVDGEKSGISETIGWKGGGHFVFYSFDNSAAQVKIKQDIHPIAHIGSIARTNKEVVHYHQLDLFEVLQQYPEYIVENNVVCEDFEEYNANGESHGYIVKTEKNVLVSLVRPDNVEHYLDQSARIYYTGKKFPSSVALNKLYYFMPYIKRKGIRDLYLIKIARVGTRKEGQPDNDPNDFRLVLEIEFVKKLFKDYKPVELKIWRTYTDTNLRAILSL